MDGREKMFCNCFGHGRRGWSRSYDVKFQNNAPQYQPIQRPYCSCWFLSKFSFEYLIKFQILTGALQHFVSWFPLILWITVLISMLTSLVCAGDFQPGSYHCQPSAVCAAPPRPQDSTPRMRMRICCSAFSPSSSAARGQPGDWPLCSARSAPGAAQRVEQAERRTCDAQQQMHLQM